MALTLRKKTLLFVTLTLVVLIIALFFINRSIVLERFSELEEDDVRADLKRVNEAFDAALAEMSTNAKSYAFPGTREELDNLVNLLEGNDRSIDEATGLSGTVSLMLNTLDGANVFLLTDTEGRMLWGLGYDEETGKKVLVPRSLGNELEKGGESVLVTHPQGNASLAGVVLLPEGSMMVASEYKLNSQGPGHIGMTLVGKWLREEEIMQFSEQTQLSLDIRRLEEDGLPGDFREANNALPSLSDSHIRTISNEAGEERIAGYIQRADVYGIPVMTLRIDQPRDIIEEGKGSILALLISVIVVGVVLVILIAFLLDRLLLSRLARLDLEVSAIGGGAENLSQRVTIQGNDELSRLGVSINGMLGDIQVERKKSEDLLLNVLPVPIANRLKEGETTIADNFSEVSVLFPDVVGFTQLSATVSATALVNMLNRVFSGFDTLTDKHGLEKIKTIGDAYMVVAGLPDPREDHAEAIVEMALEMYSELDRLNKEHGTDLEIRVGINSGPVVAGSIGTRKFSYDLWGDTVNTAARMESHGVEGYIHVIEETYRAIRDKYDFEDRGIIDVKGKGDMHTFLLSGRKVSVGPEPAATTSEDGEG